MKMQDELKRCLDQTPGLNLVAFGDVGSGLILNAASKTACPREVLDLLGENAASCFAVLRPDTPPPGSNASDFGTLMIQFTKRESRIFVRHSASSASGAASFSSAPGVMRQPPAWATGGHHGSSEA